MRHVSVALIALAFAAAPSVAADGFVERGVSRPGATYATIHLTEPSALACRAACGDDRACRAWTYIKPGMNGPTPQCELKSDVPAGRVSPCCDSGIAPRLEPGGASTAAIAPAYSSGHAGSNVLTAPPPRAPLAPTTQTELLGGPDVTVLTPAPTPGPSYRSADDLDLRRERGPRPLPENERPGDTIDAAAWVAPSAPAPSGPTNAGPPPSAATQSGAIRVSAPDQASAPVGSVGAIAAPQATTTSAPAPSSSAFSATPGANGWTVRTSDEAAPALVSGMIEPAATDVVAPGVDTRPIETSQPAASSAITFKTETVTMPAARGVPWYERAPAAGADASASQGRPVSPPRGANGAPIYSVTKSIESLPETAPDLIDETP